jgi:hypothetical protein
MGSLNFRGDYDEFATYAVNDVVFDQGSSYVLTSTAAPVDWPSIDPQWQLLAVGTPGDDGILAMLPVNGPGGAIYVPASTSFQFVGPTVTLPAWFAMGNRVTLSVSTSIQLDDDAVAPAQVPRLGACVMAGGQTNLFATDAEVRFSAPDESSGLRGTVAVTATVLYGDPGGPLNAQKSGLIRVGLCIRDPDHTEPGSYQLHHDRLVGTVMISNG